ncbi:MAG: SPFH domain-containing protein [Planctomycetota bacterium]
MPTSSPSSSAPNPAPDSLTYRRAALAAGAGLATQIGLGIFIALSGIFASSLALNAAAWHAFGGLALWISLWVLYHQHKLERLEALEAEQLAASDQQAAKLFDEAGQQLALARTRLEKLYRFGLNIVAVFIAVYLLAAGLALLVGNLNLIPPREPGDPLNLEPLRTAALDPNANLGILLALFAFQSLVAFLVARAIAGMTKVEAWQMLRGGAAYLMGCLAIALALLLATILEFAGVPGVFGLLAIVIPGFMALLGVEILLSFVFGLYRPRKPGEVPRAAFDSRLLGFLTRPESLSKIVAETLRYQFGIDFSSSWLYQLLGRALLPLIGFAAAILFGLSCLVFVQPDQQAVITHFGKNPRPAYPGLNFKAPWPIGRAQSYPVYAVQQTIVGIPPEALNNTEPILWASELNADTQTYTVIAPSRVDAESSEINPDFDFLPAATQAQDLADPADADSQAILGEYAVLGIAVRWQIHPDYELGLSRYINAAGRPLDIVESVAAQKLSAFAATRSIDQLLAVDRDAAGEALRTALEEELGPNGPYDLGIKILSVGFVTAQPPAQGEVATKFQEQAAALQERNTEVERARADESKTLAEVAGSRAQAMAINDAILELNRLNSDPDADTTAKADQRQNVEALVASAGGQASRLIAEARAARTRLILDAEARSAKFPSQVAAFNAAPAYYLQRLKYRTLGSSLSPGRKYFLPGNTDQSPLIRLTLPDESTAIEGLTN